ncbi:MAG TPA: hypothetical protein DCL77_02035 [Prolixibacteraceae bacterium]|nr:hypothetical protein [Prolixibacteraceae bacterium]
MSQKRRAIYYLKGAELPKRVKSPQFDDKGRLLDKTGNPWVRNIRTVGTPKLEQINGQKIYAATIPPYIRSTMVKQIKDSFIPLVSKQLPIEPKDFPVKITMCLYRPTLAGDWDLDNLWIYIKCFLDVLVSQQIIPDDSIRYISCSPGINYVPVRSEAERQMVFTIEKDTREEIANATFYNELHGESEEW